MCVWSSVGVRLVYVRFWRGALQATDEKSVNEPKPEGTEASQSQPREEQTPAELVPSLRAASEIALPAATSGCGDGSGAPVSPASDAAASAAAVGADGAPSKAFCEANCKELFADIFHSYDGDPDPSLDNDKVDSAIQRAAINLVDAVNFDKDEADMAISALYEYKMKQDPLMHKEQAHKTVTSLSEVFNSLRDNDFEFSLNCKSDPVMAGRWTRAKQRDASMAAKYKKLCTIEAKLAFRSCALNSTQKKHDDFCCRLTRSLFHLMPTRRR